MIPLKQEQIPNTMYSSIKEPHPLASRNNMMAPYTMQAIQATAASPFSF